VELRNNMNRAEEREGGPLPKIPAFTSFAAEDARIRDLFVGQGRHPDTPWEIVDYSLHEPFSEKWKTQTRPRIARCKVVILLIGPTTFQAEGALWEVKCGFEEGVPCFGVWISQTNRGPLPQCLRPENVISWGWSDIGAMIRKAAEMHASMNNATDRRQSSVSSPW
jgi:hypothetical protein